jgi:cytochrome c
MRYHLLLTPLILLLTACDQMNSAAAIDQKSMDLARANGCLNCHALHETRIGPPWDKVAERYPDTPAVRELLIEKVKNGSSKSWVELTGGAVMPPNSPRVADTDIEKLVDFILSLKSKRS